MSKWVIDKQFSFCYGHRVWSQKLVGEFCESGDTSCKCKHLHGHEGLVHVFLESEHLERGMVTDFKHLGWLKNFLDNNLDHKFIIDRNDPFFEKIINGKITKVEVVEKVPGTANDPLADNDDGTFRVVNKLALKIRNLDAPTHTEYMPFVDQIRIYPKPEEVLIMVPVVAPNTDVVVGYNLDTSKHVEGPEQEFYSGFFIVDFVPTSENLCKWLFDIVNNKMSRMNITVNRVDWFETPKSRSSYSQ